MTTICQKERQGNGIDEPFSLVFYFLCTYSHTYKYDVPEMTTTDRVQLL